MSTTGLPANMKAERQSNEQELDCNSEALAPHRCQNPAYPYSADGASGYVVACALHADHVLESAILDGSITFPAK